MQTETLRSNGLSKIVRHCVATHSTPGRLDIDAIDDLTSDDLRTDSQLLEPAVRGPPQRVHGAIHRAVTYARKENRDISSALARAFLETGRDTTAIAAATGAHRAAVEEVVSGIVKTTDPLEWAVIVGHTNWLLDHVQETRHVVQRHKQGQPEVPFVIAHELCGPSGTVSVTRPLTVDRDTLWNPGKTIELSATSEAAWNMDGARACTVTGRETWTVDAHCLTDLDTLRAHDAATIDPKATYAAVINSALGAELYPTDDRTPSISFPEPHRAANPTVEHQ